jgi:hypothetical protein
LDSDDCGSIKKKEIWIFQDLAFHPPASKRIKSVSYNDEIYYLGGLLGGAFFGPPDIDTSDVYKFTPCY